MHGDDLVTLKNIVIVCETQKAYGCAVADEESDSTGLDVQFWVPVSLVDMMRLDKENPSLCEIDIPRWFAEKNALDYEE